MKSGITTIFSDAGERRSRFYPALIAVIPLVGVAAGMFGAALEIEQGILTLLASFGVCCFLATIAHELGEKRESDLFESWGGKPPVQLLRHRDRTIDPTAKERCHAFLRKKLKVTLPSAADEESDPPAADRIYKSGVEWLLDHTRDTKKFDLLFLANTAYIFRRNCLGLKPYGITIACGSAAWVLIASYAASLYGFGRETFVSIPHGAAASLAVSLAMLVVWLLLITGRTVRTAAFACAAWLLQACDMLDNAPDRNKPDPART